VFSVKLVSTTTLYVVIRSGEDYGKRDAGIS
jgi:hypothetical protein